MLSSCEESQIPGESETSSELLRNDSFQPTVPSLRIVTAEYPATIVGIYRRSFKYNRHYSYSMTCKSVAGYSAVNSTRSSTLGLKIFLNIVNYSV